MTFQPLRIEDTEEPQSPSRYSNMVRPQGLPAVSIIFSCLSSPKQNLRLAVLRVLFFYCSLHLLSLSKSIDLIFALSPLTLCSLSLLLYLLTLVVLPYQAFHLISRWLFSCYSSRIVFCSHFLSQAKTGQPVEYSRKTRIGKCPPCVETGRKTYGQGWGACGR